MTRTNPVKMILSVAILTLLQGLVRPSAKAIDACWEDTESIAVGVNCPGTITLALHCDGQACCGFAQTFHVDAAAEGPTTFSVPYTYTLGGECPVYTSGLLCGTITGIDVGVVSATIIHPDGSQDVYYPPFEPEMSFCNGDDVMLVEARACGGDVGSPTPWKWLMERSGLLPLEGVPHSICQTERDYCAMWPVAISECTEPGRKLVYYPLAPDPIQRGSPGHFRLSVAYPSGPNGYLERLGPSARWQYHIPEMTWQDVRPAAVLSMHGSRLVHFAAGMSSSDDNDPGTLTVSNTQIINFYFDSRCSPYLEDRGLQLLDGQSVVWQDAHCFGHTTAGTQVDPLADWITETGLVKHVEFMIEPLQPGEVNFHLTCADCSADSKAVIIEADIDWPEHGDDLAAEATEDDFPFFVPFNDNDDNGNHQYDYLDTGTSDPDLRPLRLRIGPAGGHHGGTVELTWGFGETDDTRPFRVWADSSRTSELADIDDQGHRTCHVTWDAAEFGVTKTVYIEAVCINSSSGSGSFGFTYNYTYTADDDTVAYGLDSDHITVLPVQIDVWADSLNDNPWCYPDTADDPIEDAVGPDYPGLLLPVNDDNDDDDPPGADGQGPGLDDRLDGYNANGTDGDADDSNLDVGGSFCENDLRPVLLSVRHPLFADWDEAHYLADSLISISVEGGQAPPGDTLSGKIRLWRQRGDQDDRPNDRLNCDPLTDWTCIGDFIPDGRRALQVPDGDWVADGVYLAGDLGLGVPACQGGWADEQILLWIEGIRPSQSLADVRLVVKIDADGDNHTGWDHVDALRVTASKYDLDVDSDNNDNRHFPARDPQEDLIEADAPGKIIPWNNDDDDENGTPDYLDAIETDDDDGNDLIPMIVEVVPGARWRLEVQRSGDGQVRIWKERTKGSGQQILPAVWNECYTDTLCQTFYLEGIAASSQWGDIQIALKIDADGDGNPDYGQSADVVRVTILDIKVQAFPNEPTDIDADISRIYAVDRLTYRDPVTGDYVDAADDSPVSWQLILGTETGSYEPQTASVDGGAVCRLETCDLAGEIYQLKGTLTALALPEDLFPNTPMADGCTVGCGIPSRTAVMTVVPGQPADIWLSCSKDMYHADGTDTVDFMAVIFDAANNLVADDTVVSWELDDSTSDFLQKQTETFGGIATATLQAPAVPAGQRVIVTSGAAHTSTIMNAQRVSAPSRKHRASSTSA